MSVEDDIRRGLLAKQKSLPAYLFYDARGGQLFTQITELPEYYLTRAEREIFTTQRHEITSLALRGDGGFSVLELGAGSADKTQILLSALAKRGDVTFYPVDVDAASLELCKSRLGDEEPNVRVVPMLMQNHEALARFQQIAAPKAIFFIGSSIGNLSDTEAILLLQEVREALSPNGALVLGADQKKDIPVLLRAYDDSQGVTAAFNLNILAHLNQRFEADFNLSAFSHRALWNEERSAIEMHLVSKREQRVSLASLSLSIFLQEGETIHTESCAKYDAARMNKLLTSAKLTERAVFFDPAKQFAVYVATPSNSEQSSREP